MLLNNKYCH